MSTNKFMQDGFTDGQAEIDLLDDITREIVEIWGNNTYYMPRTLIQEDKILGEDPLSQFNKAWEIEMMMVDATGFGNDGELMGKIGWYAQKTITLQVSMTKFRELTNGQYVPHPGDLIYHRLSGAIYEVSFCNDGAATQWAIGNTDKYYYTLYCNMFQYSHEQINTGMGEIDDIADGVFNDGTDQNGLVNDGGADNTEIEKVGGDFTDFSETSPLGRY